MIKTQSIMIKYVRTFYVTMRSQLKTSHQ